MRREEDSKKRDEEGRGRKRVRGDGVDGEKGKEEYKDGFRGEKEREV